MNRLAKVLFVLAFAAWLCRADCHQKITLRLRGHRDRVTILTHANPIVKGQRIHMNGEVWKVVKVTRVCH